MDGTIGEIRHFAAGFTPRNWAPCNGGLVAIRSNTALFSIIGTYYGGDGSTTFGLPDFGGRVAIGMGQGPGLTDYIIGEKAGLNTVMLTTAELPQHTHVSSAAVAIPAYSDFGDANTPGGNILAAKGAMYSSVAGEDEMRSTTYNVTVTPIGSNQPLSIMQPTIGMNYIICLTGTFPSRS
ncbi:phage tail protein [Flavobacterium branchiicola]|uniref:Phage tail protein n=1 Tax=Flavobacterium branchiicola TaxID=1114875 RepID=A0ABV9PH40_9FLAO|nr:tail fiber protein [Flavobacterium branchiicola]MBS7255795.1 phage tail protein [Flavobacterium branchiicola]